MPAVITNNTSMKCPEKYILSQNSELCYHLVQHWAEAYGPFPAGYDTTHLFKNEAVQHCALLSNGTLPYSECK